MTARYAMTGLALLLLGAAAFGVPSRVNLGWLGMFFWLASSAL